MKTRIMTVVASVTLLCLTSGCGVMRQFWFGRGARCGPHAPKYVPVAPPAPCHAPIRQQPVAAVPQAGCGCETAAPVYAREVGCGIESYGGVINDPYLSGEIVGNGVIMGEYPYASGQIVGDGVIVGEYPAGSSLPGTVMPDNFGPAQIDSQGYRSNKFDTDGARIISEEPLPPGVTPAI